jgi:hypothetical protein
LPLYSTGARSTPYVTSYSNWQPQWKSGKFDPSVDNYFVPNGSGPFPLQGSSTGSTLTGFGNSTRYNPSLRQFPNLNENVSVVRGFPIRESIRLEFRAEAFNLFNRVRFGVGSNGDTASVSLQDPNFGKLTSSTDLLNTPRQLQLALKLYF